MLSHSVFLFLIYSNIHHPAVTCTITNTTTSNTSYCKCSTSLHNSWIILVHILANPTISLIIITTWCITIINDTSVNSWNWINYGSDAIHTYTTHSNYTYCGCPITLGKEKQESTGTSLSLSLSLPLSLSLFGLIDRSSLFGFYLIGQTWQTKATEESET
jgi:hypothetical protein